MFFFGAADKLKLEMNDTIINKQSTGKKHTTTSIQIQSIITVKHLIRKGNGDGTVIAQSLGQTLCAGLREYGDHL